MRILCLAFASALAACASTTAGQAHDSPVAAPAKVTPITRTATTISGQALKLPQGPAEMVAASVEIPAGGRLAIHRHPWSRFVYVERGRVAVHNHDTGANFEAGAGQVLAELVGQWHEAKALDNAPARLIVIDLVPPGVINMEMKPK